MPSKWTSVEVQQNVGESHHVESCVISRANMAIELTEGNQSFLCDHDSFVWDRSMLGGRSRNS